ALLVELQLHREAASLGLGPHREHVRVLAGLACVRARDPVDEAEEPSVLERARGDASRVADSHEVRERGARQVLPAPCRAAGGLELGGCPELPEDDPAHERLLFSANDWPLASRVRSAARRGRSDSRTCSSQAWAPAPRGPRPSSVGTPAAAVRFPSEAPPTRAAPSSKPSAAAAACAPAYRAWDAGVGSIRGRAEPPRGPE